MRWAIPTTVSNRKHGETGDHAFSVSKQQHPEEYASGWSHVAFSVGDRETVMSITEKITGAGHALYSSPRETGDGYFESCVADPDGNRVEITI